HHLRGDDNDVMSMPPLTAYIRTDPPYDGESVAGYWRAESDWPPPDVQEWVTDLSDLAVSGKVWDGPQWVGAHAPAWDRSGITGTDSSRDDAHSLTYTSDPFTGPVEILGTPQVEVLVTTDQSYGLVAARLLGIDPAGNAHLICRGNRNLAFPTDFAEPRAPQPGRETTVRFPLMATSATIPAGWRLRLSIAGADFPVVWPPPGRFTLSIDPEQSKLILPIVHDREGSQALEVAQSEPPPDPPVDFIEDESSWSIDSSDGRTRFSRVVTSLQSQPERNHLTYGSDQRWTVTVADDDPGTTAVESTSTLILSRPGWDNLVEARISITGSSVLRLEIDLSATHNGDRIWSKTWEEIIPRRWV
ncbi:MAG: hypothetical protein OEM32_08365, partial [Acidimicrobiia bacterium]|nr:hypothetical protein [Acidimicrobiia bacterium]